MIDKQASPVGATAPAWRPDRLAARLPLLKKRAAIAAALRQHFAERGFTEVETPALQLSPAMEPHLAAFATETIEGAPLYLHTSPEFAMKKLLAGGMERIFQLARAFRNEPPSSLHHPEFTMLEWYRAGSDYRVLMDDVTALCRQAAAVVGTPLVERNGASADLNASWQRISVAEAFDRYCAIDLYATIDDSEAPSPALLAEAASAVGLETAADDRWEDIFFRLFLNRIEPQLGIGAPTLLYDYPACMAALARTKPGEPAVAERVELYVCGLELANGFSELTDAAEQRRRWLRDTALRLRLYGRSYPVDEDFLAALEHGLPPAAGMALGFDRLVMLMTGAARIEDVLWLPVAAG